MRSRIEFIVFWVGVIPIAFFYEHLKAMFSSGIWFLIVGITYLLALRLVGRLLQRALGHPDGNS